ncbi:MAG: alpha/beta hydrolase [Candidatus Nomurabacteria bacterium]|nr:alpha/beta hydrolase [Candidatus Saccharibacteria bacterium]USN95351.1 MAG: alpha/beta hydrolase [Candidatus Nomurabacteria bacterium]
MQVIVNSLLVNYRIIGKEKETITMLHGWGDSLSTFDRIATTLSNKYTVILLDLPGFGGTQPPSQPWGLDEYAKFVADFSQKVGCQNLRAVVGHSNGGAIALRGLGSGVIRADKLVLLASAGIRNQYKGRKRGLRLAAKTAKLMTKPLPKQIQARLKKKAYGAIGSDLFVAEHLQDTFKRIITDDTQADAAKVRIPCLLIYGSEDTATPPEYGEIYHKAIGGSNLHIISGAGHFLHHTHTEQVSKLVEEFLK